MSSNEIALSAINCIDTLGIMGQSKSDTRRGRTVPIEDWWADAVRRERPRFFPTQAALAEFVGVAPSEITRCLKPRNDPECIQTLELVTAISDALKLPYPVIIPDSEPLAKKLSEERRIFKSLLEFEAIKAGVPGLSTADQTAQILSGDAPTKRSSKQKGGSGAAARRPRVRLG